MVENDPGKHVRPPPSLLSRSDGDREHPHSMLIVDDDRIFRERLAKAFAVRGYEVSQVSNHAQAIAVAKVESPEFAVVDLRMPGPSGLEVVRDLKTIDPTTRVVVLTGYGSIANAVDAMKLGATNYLTKPADADDILAAFSRGDTPPLEPTPKSYTPPSLARAEWEHIHRVLTDCGGNISQAAKRLGIHRRSLQRKLRKFAPE